jgi:hypothetical protein
MNLITDLTRWIGANMDSWSCTPAYPGTAIRQSKPGTLGCALLFHIHKTEQNIHHAKQHNLLKSEGLSCKHHFHFYRAKRDAEYWEFFYLGTRKGEQRLGWERRHLPEIAENLHQQQFKGNHDNKHNHNLMRENRSQSVIIFIMSSSDELPWLPTDSISFQQSGVDNYITICPKFWANRLGGRRQYSGLHMKWAAELESSLQGGFMKDLLEAKTTSGAEKFPED